MKRDPIALAEALEKRADHLGQMLSDPPKPHPDAVIMRKAARAILDAKREAYEDAAKYVSGPAAWLERWAQHVGSCRGGGHCTCGLTLARAEINAIRAKAEGLGK